MKTVQLMAGTRKGAFLFTSDLRRENWKLSGHFQPGNEVNHFAYDPRAGRHWLAVTSWFFGSRLEWSGNAGKKWHVPKTSPKCTTKDMTLKRLWTVAFGDGALWCGGDPGVLFRSDDGGNKWYEITSLTKHRTRKKWQPGAGGMCTHSILPDPFHPKRIYVGISAAGVFRSDDGGKSWEPLNKNTRADFMPNKFPEVGQCVHHLAMSRTKPDWLFQQNHCGVYRSTNAAEKWDDISKGLPSRFGFPMIVHPHEKETVYVVPENGAERRYVCDAKLTVYRSHNGGKSWQKLTRGLPQKNCYAQVLRQASAADMCDDPGLYLGTNTGEIFFSRNGGDSWELIQQHLPPILSLEAHAG